MDCGNFSFECRRCGNCCRHSGYVFLTDGDIKELAGALSISEDDFLRGYCKTVCTGGRFRISLLERASGECLFVTDKGCEVYGARPQQCRTFPYWKRIMTDGEELQRTKEYCKGIIQKE